MAGGVATRMTIYEMHGAGVDFELETRVANFYLAFWALSLNNETSTP